ncbi:hypothetical protein [Chelatococcus sp. YT9]|uniref:hypothetical protein n=1 Tax=Chelatococcus sp. YT9 TaxID=2835635 RepID=UPI001BD0358B|nr:hypothetical protein [Chelatococcus sp. YT9]MBS7698569.1 hypothetical protein [Chelatococcus sp. YT9]
MEKIVAFHAKWQELPNQAESQRAAGPSGYRLASSEIVMKRPSGTRAYHLHYAAKFFWNRAKKSQDPEKSEDLYIAAKIKEQADILDKEEHLCRKEQKQRRISLPQPNQAGQSDRGMPPLQDQR